MGSYFIGEQRRRGNRLHIRDFSKRSQNKGEFYPSTADDIARA